MMQPARSIGKEESPLGGRIVSGGTRNRHMSTRERHPGGSEDADGVLGNKVRDASVDEEAGVIDIGGDAAGGRAAASVVADPRRLD